MRKMCWAADWKPCREYPTGGHPGVPDRLSSYRGQALALGLCDPENGWNGWDGWNGNSLRSLNSNRSKKLHLFLRKNQTPRLLPHSWIWRRSLYRNPCLQHISASQRRRFSSEESSLPSGMSKMRFLGSWCSDMSSSISLGSSGLVTTNLNQALGEWAQNARTHFCFGVVC